jgi:membrane associated rhomboid family serine protease
MAGTPDLFVVCKACGREVSPYITECPYCGARLRKRAPKIERDGGGEGRPKRPRRIPTPSLGPLRTGEIPGIRGDETARPVATIVLVALSVAGFLLLALVSLADVGVAGALGRDYWRIATSPFLYDNAWYQLACVLAIGLFGWRLELRHGPVFVVVLFAVSAMGGIAVASAVDASPLAAGGNGAALAFLVAWALPDLRRQRAGDDHDGDLLGALAVFVVVLLMPLAVVEANAVVGVVGLVAGGLAGLVGTRPRPGAGRG